MARPKKICKDIDAVISNIEKLMGNKGDPIIYKVNENEVIDVISFDYPDVDKASNCGGVPKGKLVEIFGSESGGKSFLSLKLIASAQKKGLPCCLVDAEQSFDPKWAKKHGVDVKSLYIINEPMSAEKILDYVILLCKSGAFGVVVVDSTAALIPSKELEGKVGDQDYALLARAMSKACRQIIAHCGSTGTICVLLNQIREKMNVMFGDAETTPGGRALKFYSHIRIKVTPGRKIKVKEGNSERVIARSSWVQFVKNKVASPYGQCTLEIVFDETAMNPVVKLCNAAKDYKVVSLREGEFKLGKDMMKAKKNVDTGCKSMVELADYLVKNDMVLTVANACVGAYEDDPEEDKNGDVVKINPIIKEIIDNPSIAVSPLKGDVSAVQVNEAPAMEEDNSDDMKMEEEEK